MSAWDAATWAAVLVLGPGAVAVFAAFLRDARRLLGGGAAGGEAPGDDREAAARARAGRPGGPPGEAAGEGR